MYRLIYFIIAIFLTVSCSPKVRYIPVHSDTNVRDSVIVSYRDSIRVIPIERIVDIVAEYDTLFLETSLAKSVAYVDTNTHSLKGTIENKQAVQYRYVTEYKTEYRDSIVFQEKPYPVEKIVRESYIPWWAKILSIIGGISLAVAAGYVASKFI
jgi:hypothetical protein